MVVISTLRPIEIRTAPGAPFGFTLFGFAPVRIGSVDPGSAAERKGLRKGCVVLLCVCVSVCACVFVLCVGVWVCVRVCVCVCVYRAACFLISSPLSDVIWEVNGRECIEASHNDVVDMVRQIPNRVLLMVALS
jgi:hypothetical protein